MAEPWRPGLPSEPRIVDVRCEGRVYRNVQITSRPFGFIVGNLVGLWQESRSHGVIFLAPSCEWRPIEVPSGV